MTSSPTHTDGPATSDLPPEVVDVREGEALDWTALETWLRAQLDVTGDFRVLQFPNGSANLTYLVSFGGQRFVVRRPPFGRLARGAHDMRREHRVLSRLWRTYPRAPRAYALCTDHDVVGADFLVMEYRSGVVVWRDLPPSMQRLADAGRRVGFAVVDALADLHLVDPASADLKDLGRPEGFLDRQVRGWTQRWEAVAPEEPSHPAARLGEQLARTVPSSPSPSVIHNDFKVDNCQFQPGAPDEVTSVFDWDMATLGDPLVDLGTLLNYWPDPVDDPDAVVGVTGVENLGLPGRRDVVKRYAVRTGLDLSGIEWYVAYGCWKTAVILQQLHDRYLRGETADDRMAQRGTKVRGLAERGLAALADA